MQIAEEVMSDTIDMAREAGFMLRAEPVQGQSDWWECFDEAIEKLAALVRADERKTLQAESEADKLIIQYHEATIKRLEAAPVQEPVAHDEDWLEKMYWEFDATRNKSGEERLRFKGFMRAYGTKCANTTPPAAQPAVPSCAKCGAPIGSLHVASGNLNCGWPARVQPSDCIEAKLKEKNT
jgi:hypothetical protein